MVEQGLLKMLWHKARYTDEVARSLVSSEAYDAAAVLYHTAGEVYMRIYLYLRGVSLQNVMLMNDEVLQFNFQNHPSFSGNKEAIPVRESAHILWDIQQKTSSILSLSYEQVTSASYCVNDLREWVRAEVVSILEPEHKEELV